MPHDTTTLRHDHGSTGAAADARRRPSTRPDPCDDTCPPACPACGGLECFCRPRFFPGQLLTDDDLNRLMKYLTGKNRLHNRYLHGWGVACGLEVVCDPCDAKQVRVRTGYALAPCGDDIVLCDEQAVDICALIDECTPPRRTVCDPPYDRPPADCRRGNDRWVLAVCYDERPSRGLTALLGAADSRCRQPCSCGGSTGCTACGGSGCAGGASCGCGGAGPGSCPSPKGDYNSRPRRTMKAECEPTQICEGHRFIVYPAPPPLTRATLPNFDSTSVLGVQGQLLAWLFSHRERLGPLLERVLCCVARARELLSSWGGSTKIDRGSAASAYLQYAEAMYEFANEFSIHRCAFVGTVGRLYDNASLWRARFAGASAIDDTQLAYARDQMVQLENSLIEIVGECFCSALLPPCPESTPSNCVPLAVVTLSRNDCRVVDICNWEQRKILLTWRTVAYWLSWVPWHCLRHEIAKFCCGTGRGGSMVLQLMGLMFGVGTVGLLGCGERRPPPPAPSPPPPAPPPGPVGMVAGAHAHVSTGASHGAVGDVEAARRSDDLVMHLLGEFDRARSGAIEAPAWYALAARLADGSLLADVAGTRAKDTGATKDTGGDKDTLDALRAEVEALSKAVKSQQARINTLSKKR
jgi:hypothetical protein